MQPKPEISNGDWTQDWPPSISFSYQINLSLHIDISIKQNVIYYKVG